MKTSIDLYLISGFLGSGKTTFLRQLLEQITDKKVGVIVNEFGSVGIDGKVLNNDDLTMVEINNGSIFCACLKGGFVKTLVAFLDQPIDVLFIEASGMADPSSMKQLLEQFESTLGMKQRIGRQYTYRGSICLIDAARFIEFCDLFQPTVNQVKKSSLLILNKIDEVSGKEIQELHERLYELNPGAYIFDTEFGRVPVSLLENKISPDGVLEAETTNTLWNRPVTYVLQMKERYEPEMMKKLALSMSEKVLRFKGFFITTSDDLAHADCVGDYIRIEMIEKDSAKTECCELVMIGKNSEDFETYLLEVWNKYFPGNKISYEKA